jgi:hypothetical protein
MLKKRGALQRKVIMLSSSFGSIAELAGGLWRSDSGKRWLVPLAVFLAITGIALTVAATVEALAPFVYSIF